MKLKTLLTSVVACMAVSQVKADTLSLETFLSTNFDYNQQHECLAMNIYHEARGDSVLGQKAVGFVTMNRVNDKRYPNTVCDVVYDAYVDSRGNPIRNKCQFSWYCDGKSDTPRSKDSWRKAKEVATQVLYEYGNVQDFTEGSVMYHASYVNPYWAKSYERVVRIDTHIFYK
jgi:spore germination cell wall hydrolase CwlJ-like protein